MSSLVQKWAICKHFHMFLLLQFRVTERSSVFPQCFQILLFLFPNFQSSYRDIFLRVAMLKHHLSNHHILSSIPSSITQLLFCSLFDCLCVCLFVCLRPGFPVTSSLYQIQLVQRKLAPNSQRSACFCLLSAGIKTMSHHCPTSHNFLNHTPGH